MKNFYAYLKLYFTTNTLTVVEDKIRKDLADIEAVVSEKREEIKLLTQSRDNINARINESLHEIERAERIRVTISKTIGDTHEAI